METSTSVCMLIIFFNQSHCNLGHEFYIFKSHFGHKCGWWILVFTRNACIFYNVILYLSNFPYYFISNQTISLLNIHDYLEIINKILQPISCIAYFGYMVQWETFITNINLFEFSILFGTIRNKRKGRDEET